MSMFLINMFQIHIHIYQHSSDTCHISKTILKTFNKEYFHKHLNSLQQ